MTLFEECGEGGDEVVFDVFGAGTLKEDMYLGPVYLIVTLCAQALVVRESLGIFNIDHVGED